MIEEEEEQGAWSERGRGVLRGDEKCCFFGGGGSTGAQQPL